MWLGYSRRTGWCCLMCAAVVSWSGMCCCISETTSECAECASPFLGLPAFGAVLTIFSFRQVPFHSEYGAVLRQAADCVSGTALIPNGHCTTYDRLRFAPGHRRAISLLTPLQTVFWHSHVTYLQTLRPAPNNQGE